MIGGMKVTLSASKLGDLCTARAVYHEGRVEVYREQVANFKASGIEGVQMTNGDPTVALVAKCGEHKNAAEELRFIADNLDPVERYVLGRDDLHKLGISASRY
jgi:hypothetical protein